jgi:predicted dehydrogenase
VVSAHLRFESGVTAYLNSILATPFFMRTRIFGSNAWVEARDTARPEVEGITYLTLCRAGGEPETREMPSVNTVVVNLDAFADAVSGHAPYPFTAEEMVHNIAVLEAISRSVDSGQAVSVP